MMLAGPNCCHLMHCTGCRQVLLCLARERQQERELQRCDQRFSEE